MKTAKKRHRPPAAVRCPGGAAAAAPARSRRIRDEFTDLPISRQRKYQLRRQQEGRCTQCGQPAVLAQRCLKHLIDARERQRKLHPWKRRYYRTISYRLERRGRRRAS